MCGDFNINYLQTNKESSLLLDLFASFEIKNTLPVEPTREKNGSSSAIDYIATNIKKFTGHNLDIDLSDHKVQISKCTLDQITLPNRPKDKIIKIRIFSQHNLTTLYNLLLDSDFNNVYHFNNTNNAWESFWGIFYYCFDIACPLNNIKIKNNNEAGWVDDEVKLKSSELKDLYWLSKSLNNNDITSHYKNAKRIFTNILNTKKREYYNTKISKANITCKEVWKIVNDKLDRKEKSPAINSITISGNIVENPIEICETFCEYFTTVAKTTLNNHFPALDYDNSNLKGTLQSIFFEDITVQEIRDVISTMPNKKSSGPDGVPISVVKSCLEIIIEPLCYIFNLSIRTSTFPDKWKTASIIPIFKQGSHELIENFRPITLVSSFSKILEKIIHNRITKFLDSHKILSSRQHGFRSNYSTNTATYDLLQFIYEGLDKNKFVLGLFFDFTKAFDCVIPDSLIDKLHKIGIRGHLNGWIESFLKNRKVYVKIGESNSHSRAMNLGVPQGAALSPLLFAVFINDLDEHMREKDSLLVIFADDVSLIISAASLEALHRTATNLLTRFENWCTKNKLIVNVSKTTYITFHKRKIIQPINLLINNQTILPSDHTKFLGITIDEKLSWTNHINNVVGKLNSGYFAIRNLKSFLDRKYLMNVYYALIYPHLKYLIIYWGQGTDWNRVFILQKRIMRLIFGLSPRESCKNIFKENKILTLPSILILEAVMFTKQKPELYNHRNDIHNYSTRYNTNIQMDQFNLSTFKKSPKYTCSNIYNNLPRYLKELSRSKLKKKLLEMLQNKAYYSLGEYFDQGCI